jgi:transcriptional regulator with XRE-family HTH domain
MYTIRGVTALGSPHTVDGMAQVKNRYKTIPKPRIKPQAETLRTSLSVEMGRRVRLKRELLGESQGTISRAIDRLLPINNRGHRLADPWGMLIPLSSKRIANFEQGTRHIGVREAFTLAQVLQSDPCFLLCLEDRPVEPIERELLKNFRSLPENERSKFAARLAAAAMPYRITSANTGDWIGPPPEIPPPKTRARK